MNIIVDTSVIIAVIANEPEKPALIALTKEANLFVSASTHWEVGNAFSAMLKRKRVSMAQAQKAIEAYYRIPLRFVDVDLIQALQLAERLAIYAYDAYILGCALDLQCPLLALDQQLIKSAKQVGIKVLEVKT